MEQALVTVADTSAADIHDFDLERLWNWKNAGKRIRNHPLVKSGRLAKSLSMGSRRFGASLTEWDGNLSSAAKGSRFARRLGESALSPTSLERWAKCPFSYFLGNVLRRETVRKKWQLTCGVGRRTGRNSKISNPTKKLFV